MHRHGAVRNRLNICHVVLGVWLRACPVGLIVQYFIEESEISPLLQPLDIAALSVSSWRYPNMNNRNLPIRIPLFRDIQSSRSQWQ